VIRRVGPLLLAVVARTATGQAPLPIPTAARAESLAAEGRPWHAAETLIATTARSPNPSVALVLASARAELAAHRYDRGLALLVGQPWIGDSADGAGLALLADAELHVGRPLAAALHFTAARAHAEGPRAALLAVRAAHAFQAGGAPDSAAIYYAAARRAGLNSIDGWLRVREAEVTRDTAPPCWPVFRGRRRGKRRAPGPVRCWWQGTRPRRRPPSPRRARCWRAPGWRWRGTTPPARAFCYTAS
jgi:hypothetical protein